MSDEKVSPTVTPIKKSMRYQRQQSQDTVDADSFNGLRAFDVSLNGREVQIKYDGDDGIIIDGRLYHSKVIEEEDGNYTAEVYVEKEDLHHYKLEYADGSIFMEGRLVLFDFTPSLPKLVRKRTMKSGKVDIKAPLPGIVSAINVKVGDKVKVGTKLIILEAMKMQNDILSDMDGTVKEIYIAEGQQLATNERMLLIVSED